MPGVESRHLEQRHRQSTGQETLHFLAGGFWECWRWLRASFCPTVYNPTLIDDLRRGAWLYYRQNRACVTGEGGSSVGLCKG